MGGDQADWTEAVGTLGDRERAEPARTFDGTSPGTSHCGIYSWWADEAARRQIGQALRTDIAPLIYVGKTEQTLKRRVLRSHLRGSIRNSTFRKSLTAILKADPELAAQHPAPDVRAWREVLSDWMRQHLAVVVAPVEKARLREAEQAALDHYDPPLNLQQMPRTPARTKLSELRRRL
ncbi:MAG: hypothetical protein F4Z25_10375 [Chloroflexi bacterium]|nr:hypothetical protein [Chloroflexota bacterium]